MSKEERRWLIYVDAVNSVDEPVTVAVYDKAWPEQFAAEVARLKNELPHTAVALEHIGSTAVPGLAAKPIIDVMVGVSNLYTTDDLARRLTRLGYEDCGGSNHRRYFRKRAGDPY